MLAVHAHADDETITMGATLAQCADRGIATAVLCCTDGQLATIYAPDMDEESTRPRLGEIRREELRAACAILGVSEVHFLGYHDSGMAGAESNDDPVAFWRASLDEATGAVVAHIRRFRPHVVVTYDGNGGYGHPDHIQVHRVGRRAAELANTAKVYEATINRDHMIELIKRAREYGMETPNDELPDPEGEGFDMGMPAEAITTTVDVRDYLEIKRQAMAAHASQISETSFFLTMPREAFDIAWGQEWYILHGAPLGTKEDDIFAGLIS
jgi:LmbE family N-acetylglucosaminyl deacetylase